MPFHVGAYKRDVVVVIKMGAYVHGVLIFYGCLLSRFHSKYEFISVCYAAGECSQHESAT